MQIREMREADCLEVVTSQTIGRLASCARDQPYVVPVQYALSGGLIYSFSMPGQKIDNMRENPKVCLQVDDLRDARHWKSVIVEGRFHELFKVEDRQQAWEILQQRSNWWEPGALKPTTSQATVGSSQHLFYTISIDRLSGRQTVDA